MAISFKHVGKTTQVIESEKLYTTPSPIGIKTPLQLGSNNDGVFSMHYLIADQIDDNFRNLIQTNWGERLGMYGYGANLKEITTEIVALGEEFDNMAMTRIRDAVSKWMPYINLLSFESKIDFSANVGSIGHIRMNISYDVPSLNISERAIEVTLRVM